MKTRLPVALLITASIAVTLTAQGSSTAKFTYERFVDVTTPGPQRLEIDAALLAGSQPFTIERSGERAIATNGLGDLRFYSTADNTEIPYLLIPPSADQRVFVSGRVLPITAVDTKDDKTSGFEADLGGVMAVDMIDLGELAAPFLKRFRLEGSGDREHWTQLLGEATAFNLPTEQLRHTRIEFEAGPYRYLRITWDDTNSARIASPDHVMVRQVTASSPRSTLRAAVPVARRQSEPGRSRFRITLPAARLPITTLELTVSGGNLLRDARVFEASLVGQEARPRLLGQSRLARVVRDAIGADALSIPIAQPTEPQLDLVVDDGDNAPLALEGITAVFAELPWIYFEASGAVVARYGDPKLAAPRYDLEAARATITPDAATPSRAVWRAIPPVTLAAAPEAGLPMPDTGSPISSQGFGYLRDIPAGPAGLIAIPLDAAVMAHSGIAPRRLRDVRVIDNANFQIPYLLELRDEPLIARASLERRDVPAAVRTANARSSSYAVKVPFPHLPQARLVLTTKARVFQRSVTLATLIPAAERQPPRLVPNGALTWTHADSSIAAPSLIFPLPDVSTGELFLLVEEGDNQPLPIDEATVLMPSYALRLFRRANVPLRMMYGRDDLAAPQYDLQLLAPQVMGRAAEDVTVGPEQAMAGGGSASKFDLVSPTVFWSVLALTVVVLLALVARLIRRETT